MEYTKGPWHVRRTDDSHAMNAIYVSTKKGLYGPQHDGAQGMGCNSEHSEVVAITLLQAPRLADVEDGRWEENACLIAAAPDLYEACLYAVNATEEAEVGAKIDWRDVSAKLLSALAKAEGK